MGLTRGRNSNTNDVATITTIVLNDSTSTTVAPPNVNRTFIHITNADAVKAAWVKLQPASVDNDKKGVFLAARGSGPGLTMTPDNIYTGEISAIADQGSDTVYITEY